MVNGVTFAVSSVDSLFHVKKEEYTKSGIEVEPSSVPEESSTTDVMSNLCRQLLLQRRLVSLSSRSIQILTISYSFYPVFPTPMDVAHEVNLDVSHLDAARITTESADGADVAPDVLIIPSRYKQFVKVAMAR